MPMFTKIHIFQGEHANSMVTIEMNYVILNAYHSTM